MYMYKMYTYLHAFTCTWGTNQDTLTTRPCITCYIYCRAMYDYTIMHYSHMYILLHVHVSNAHDSRVCKRRRGKYSSFLAIANSTALRQERGKNSMHLQMATYILPFRDISKYTCACMYSLVIGMKYTECCVTISQSAHNLHVVVTNTHVIYVYKLVLVSVKVYMS